MKSDIIKQIEIQELERLVLKYPQESMNLLALRGLRKLSFLVMESTGIDVEIVNFPTVGCIEVEHICLPNCTG